MNAMYGHSGTSSNPAKTLPWFDVEVSDRVAHEIARENSTGNVLWDRLFAAGAVAYAAGYGKIFDEHSIAESICGVETWARLTTSERTRVATEAAFDHFKDDLGLASLGFEERSGIVAR